MVLLYTGYRNKFVQMFTLETFWSKYGTVCIIKKKKKNFFRSTNQTSQRLE